MAGNVQTSTIAREKSNLCAIFPTICLTVNAIGIQQLFGYPHDSTATRYSSTPCSDMPALMSITQVAAAPPCNTDGALPPFTLSWCSQSDESAFCHYCAHTVRLCPFLLQPWLPIVYFYILTIFLSVFYDKSAIFMSLLRSSSFVNPLLFDKSTFYLTANQCHSEGRREAEGKQKGGIRDSRPIHSLLASCRFCKHFWQSCIVLQR